ncbi:hypothetical protein ACHHYP_12715 [Achlya hypogyna]|uniref:Helicase-associated domain-containing protein n=1 Tax=Achlya hypogyna TaxID=1202772 RepID=A0A1V9ZGG9_ACHHY|nr:hypothetical protein ACHHYP_12715 [Achlya hypogyna]
MHMRRRWPIALAATRRGLASIAFVDEILTAAKALHSDTTPPRPRLNPPNAWRVPTSPRPLDVARLRRMYASGQAPYETVAALDALGFVWDPIAFKWSTRLAALSVYQRIHGDVLVPRGFVIPVGDMQWPRDAWNLKLGVFVHNVRSGRAVLSPKQLEQLEHLGFVWDPVEHHWIMHIAALKAYKALHGDVCVPQRFIVPPDWADTRLHGLRLGRFVNSLRTRRLSESQAATVAALGFVYNMPEYNWERKLLALRLYKEIHGDLLVPKSFVVPQAAPWPASLWGLPLGPIVRSLRNSARDDTRADLDAIGFVWDPLGDNWDMIVLALKTYEQVFGHLRVATNFVVPSNDPWPPATWRLHLGSAVTQLRHRVDDMSTEQMDLLGLIIALDVDGDTPDDDELL